EIEFQDFAVSPDGGMLAYTATAEEGEPLLSIRPFNVLEARTLPGTEGSTMPFWSPDSRNIGFFAGGKLKTIRVDGGQPVTIADADQPQGGTWSIEGSILFANGSQGLRRVPSTGGEAVKVIASDLSRKTVSYRWPQFLPDGRHVLFSDTSAEPDG